MKLLTFTSSALALFLMSVSPAAATDVDCKYDGVNTEPSCKTFTFDPSENRSSGNYQLHFEDGDGSNNGSSSSSGGNTNHYNQIINDFSTTGAEGGGGGGGGGGGDEI